MSLHLSPGQILNQDTSIPVVRPKEGSENPGTLNYQAPPTIRKFNCTPWLITLAGSAAVGVTLSTVEPGYEVLSLILGGFFSGMFATLFNRSCRYIAGLVATSIVAISLLLVVSYQELDSADQLFQKDTIRTIAFIIVMVVGSGLAGSWIAIRSIKPRQKL